MPVLLGAPERRASFVAWAAVAHATRRRPLRTAPGTLARPSVARHVGG